MSIQTFFKSLTSTSTRRCPIRRHPAAGRLQVESLEGRCLPSFSMPVDYGVGLAAQGLVSADFNGDGRLDLATVIRDDHTVSVLLGNGDGTFQTARTSGTGFYPQSLVAADLNGDGNADLVTQGISPVNTSLLLANGDGTFQPPQAITLPAQSPPGYIGPPMEQGPVSVAIGDFNGDSKLDLVAGGQVIWWITADSYAEVYVDNYANVLLGNGDGTFLPAAVKHLSAGSYFVNSGDFNNDGRLDVVLRGGVYLGNGDGTLQDILSSSIWVGDVANPVRDFSGDGKLDVLSDSAGPVLYLGNGNGAFQQAKNLDPTGEWNSSPVAGDVNADGKLDIVVMRNSVAYSYDAASDSYYDPVTTRTARVLLGHGDGSFAAPIIVGLGTVAGQIGFTTPVLADYDGNGFPDLAATETEYYFVDIYEATAYRGVHVALNDGIWTLLPPPPPAITMSDATITEGNSGTRAATFTVTLSAVFSQPVSVGYATANGSATAGSDYQGTSGTLTFPAGQTSGTITVLVNGDRLAEPNETFAVNLSAPTNATIADGQGIGTILDDEPRMSINDVTVTEGNTGAVHATFTVSLSVAYDVAVTVHYQTANGSATAGSDYAAASGDAIIAAGQTTKTFTALVIGDRSAEPTENFVVNLSAATHGLIVDSQGVGAILDNEPRISISDVSKKEGKKGQTTLFTFTVTLSAAYDQAVTMSFATMNGTAKTSDNDYNARTGTLTFNPGETTKTITIEIKGDSKKEANETFYLDLFGNSSNSLFTKNRGLGTILNDD